MKDEDAWLWDQMQETAKEQGYDSVSSMITEELRKRVGANSIERIEVETEDAKGWDIRNEFYGRWLTEPLADPDDPFDPDFDMDDIDDVTVYQVAQTLKGNIVVYSYSVDEDRSPYSSRLVVYPSIQDALDAKAAPEWVLNRAALKIGEKVVIRLAI